MAIRNRMAIQCENDNFHGYVTAKLEEISKDTTDIKEHLKQLNGRTATNTNELGKLDTRMKYVYVVLGGAWSIILVALTIYFGR